mmetsp:Transcript_13851/g.16702  ORF Transcript_13851/g.16702 Transcript_13851/m.16702 type:complete len:195 (+) Transcript_13851:85-669(+)
MGDRQPPNIDGMYSLKVDNLTYRTTPEDVEDLFHRYGKIGDVYIPRNYNTGESRGFAFVRFFDERDAEDAVKAQDGREFNGRAIRVSFASRPRPADPRANMIAEDERRRQERRSRYDDHRGRGRDSYRDDYRRDDYRRDDYRRDDHRRDSRRDDYRERDRSRSRDRHERRKSRSSSPRDRRKESPARSNDSGRS